MGVNPPADAENWVQDEDSLDTWASSWLWPFATMGWPDKKAMEDKSLKYFYPTSDLVTGPDIIFFWVARMIMAGLEFMDGDDAHKIPFKNVYFTGIIRDMQGRKMSKSLGNIVNPLDLVAQFGTDPFRYFLMREMNVGQDSDFSADQFLTRYTSDLGNDLGNLVSRTLNMSHRYCDGIVQEMQIDEEPEKTLRDAWAETSKSAMEMYEGMQFHTSLDKTFAFIRSINRYAEQRAPWKLAKSEDAQDKLRLQTSLAYMAEGLRLSAVILAPVMPQVSEKILNLLGKNAVEKFDGELEWGNSLQGSKLSPQEILFPRMQK